MFHSHVSSLKCKHHFRRNDYLVQANPSVRVRIFPIWINQRDPRIDRVRIVMNYELNYDDDIIS